jgi:hypothetical protein
MCGTLSLWFSRPVQSTELCHPSEYKTEIHSIDFRLFQERRKENRKEISFAHHKAECKNPVTVRDCAL